MGGVAEGSDIGKFCAGLRALLFLDWTCDSNFLGAGLLNTAGVDELPCFVSCPSVFLTIRPLPVNL